MYLSDRFNKGKRSNQKKGNNLAHIDVRDLADLATIGLERELDAARDTTQVISLIQYLYNNRINILIFVRVKWCKLFKYHNVL